MRNRAIPGLAVILLSGCVATNSPPPTEAQLNSGINPALAARLTEVPANYRQLVADWMRQNLKDPYSVRDAVISSPFLGFVGLLNGGNAPLVCARYNAKNSFGAYIGEQPTAFIFAHGNLQTTLEKPLACADPLPDYAPFPEAMPSPVASPKF